MNGKWLKKKNQNETKNGLKNLLETSHLNNKHGGCCCRGDGWCKYPLLSP